MGFGFQPTWVQIFTVRVCDNEDNWFRGKRLVVVVVAGVTVVVMVVVVVGVRVVVMVVVSLTGVLVVIFVVVVIWFCFVFKNV